MGPLIGTLGAGPRNGAWEVEYPHYVNMHFSPKGNVDGSGLGLFWQFMWGEYLRRS